MTLDQEDIEAIELIFKKQRKALAAEVVRQLAPLLPQQREREGVTADDEKRFRLIIREEVRAALGVDRTDNEKLAALPLADRKKFAKAQMIAYKAALKAAK